MTLGSRGEDLVAEHYCRQGYKLLDRNYIFPRGKQMGELDVVLAGKNEIIFVEVKTRRSNQFGRGLEAVDSGKQRKLVHTAKLYMQAHPKYAGWNYRIDVAEVDIDNPDQPVIIIPNAIEDLD